MQACYRLHRATLLPKLEDSPYKSRTLSTGFATNSFAVSVILRDFQKSLLPQGEG